MITNYYIRFILAFLFVAICIVLLIQYRQSSNITQHSETFTNFCLTNNNNNELSTENCDSINNTWIMSNNNEGGEIRYQGTNQCLTAVTDSPDGKYTGVSVRECSTTGYLPNSQTWKEVDKNPLKVESCTKLQLNDFKYITIKDDDNIKENTCLFNNFL